MSLTLLTIKLKISQNALKERLSRQKLRQNYIHSVILICLVIARILIWKNRNFCRQSVTWYQPKIVQCFHIVTIARMKIQKFHQYAKDHIKLDSQCSSWCPLPLVSLCYLISYYENVLILDIGKNWPKKLSILEREADTRPRGCNTTKNDFRSQSWRTSNRLKQIILKNITL